MQRRPLSLSLSLSLFSYALLLTGAGSFAYLFFSESFSRGPWRLARTVMSGTGRVPKESEDALVLLAKARSLLPPRSTVVFVKPEQRSTTNDHITYSVALGQLSEQRVLPAASMSAGPPPQYVIAFRGVLVDERYELVHDLPEGRVYALRGSR